MKSTHNNDNTDEEKWKRTVLTTIEGGSSKKDDDSNNLMKVKQVRKLVFLSLQVDDDDDNKVYKKLYKKSIQSLEKDGIISLDTDGTIHYVKKAKTKKSSSKDSSSSDIKKKKDKNSTGNDNNNHKKRKVVEEEKEITTSNDNERHEKKMKMNKKEKKENEEKKRNKKHLNNETNDDHNIDYNHHHDIETNDPVSNTNNDDDDDDDTNKNEPCDGNPQGITRLFVGNLPFNVDETILETFIPGITHIKWITDKDTGQFYGSSFIEMKTSIHAAAAITKNAQQLSGRPIKINYAPARPNEIWPPEQKIISGGKPSSSDSQKQSDDPEKPSDNNKKMIKTELGPPPDGCQKLFLGNLSYDIDDDGIKKLFDTVDAEVKAIRWIHHKENGDFKGVGFVEFWNAEACIRAATLNGKNVLGRPIRIDWTD